LVAWLSGQGIFLFVEHWDAEGRWMFMRVQVLLKVPSAAILLAALTPPILSHAGGTACGAPIIEVAPQIGGQRQFKIQSPCRKGELVIARYGELVIMERFDGSGNLAFQLDCFQGDREVDLTFLNNWRTTNRSCSAVENALTKVAIVWRDHVDLDLHALEYAAPPGSGYDRSASNPGSYQTAQLDYLDTGRSRGFMSTLSDGQQLGHNLEVYTLARHPDEPRGLIAMAVALGSRDNVASRESCSNGRREPLRVDLDVYLLERGTKVRSYGRAFAAPPCDDAGRFVTNLVPNIRLGTSANAE
jgi:hypothetical protein